MLNGLETEAKTIGYTDKDGKFEALIEAHHKTPVAISLTPPKGYSFSTGTDLIDDTLLVKPDEKDGTLVHANTLILNATYQSKEVEHLVWVKLDCPSRDGNTLCKDMPLKIDDEIVATTDLEGRAHFTVSEVPGKTLRVTLDTTASLDDDRIIDLEPLDPGYNLELPNKPQVFTIEQTLTEPEEKPEEEVKPKAKKTRRVAKKRRPSKKKKRASTKKKKSSGSLSFGPKKSTKKKSTSKPKKSGNGISLF